MKKFTYGCIAFMVISVMLGFASVAFAAAPSVYYSYTWPASGANQFIYTTGLSACESSVAAGGMTAARYTPPTACSGIPAGRDEGWRSGAGAIQSRVRCTDGTAPNTSLPTAQQCADPAPTCVANSTTTSTFYRGYTTPGGHKADRDVQPFPKSDGQCVVDYTPDECWGKDSTTHPGFKDIYCSYNGVRSGAPAGNSEQPPSSAVKDSSSTPAAHDPIKVGQGQACPAGTMQTGTDSSGGAICDGSGTNVNSKEKVTETLPPTTTTLPNGDNKRVDEIRVTNADGSVTTNVKTTYTTPDGHQRVHESSTTGNIPGTNVQGTPGGWGGGGGGGSTPGENPSDICKTNPNLNVCKNSSVAGDCENTSCQGDAIQCAILRQQRKQYCDDNKENPHNQLANQVLSGNDPLKAKLPTKQNAQTVAMGNLNQDSFLGSGGACIADQQISFGGQTVTLPFSAPCDHAVLLRFIIMSVAGLVSLRILAKPVLGS